MISFYATATASYSYDAFNQRTAKPAYITGGSSDTETYFYYDSTGNVCYERKGNDISSGDKKYLNGVFTEGVTTGDTGDNSDGTFSFYVHNAQGDVVSKSQSLNFNYLYDEIIENHGSLDFNPQMSSTTYDAYGNVTSGTSGSVGYRGYYRDFESGLYYLKARYYDSTTRSFTQQDPAKDGSNWYGYCSGNPIMYSDPTGMWKMIGDGRALVTKEAGDTAASLYAFLVGGTANMQESDVAGMEAYIAKYCRIGTAQYINDAPVGTQFSLDSYARFDKDWADANVHPADTEEPIIDLNPALTILHNISIYSDIKSFISDAGNAFLSSLGYDLSRAMFNHALWGYGRTPSTSIKELLIEKLKESSIMNGIIAGLIANASGNKIFKVGTVEFDKSNPTNADLYYSLQHADYYIIGEKSGETWNLSVNVLDTYDFDSMRLTSELSLGSAANDLGLIMQNVGMMVPYFISVSYSIQR